MDKRLAWLAAIPGALTLFACATGPSDTQSPQTGPNPSVASEPAPQDGTFSVPEQFKPGSYKTVVPEDSFGCYWARLKGTSGSPDDIIANGVGSPTEMMRITVKSTDKYFNTIGCGSWEKEN